MSILDDHLRSRAEREADKDARIAELTAALKAMRDAGTYLLATQANKKLVETANTKFMAALDQARATLAAVGEKK